MMNLLEDQRERGVGVNGLGCKAKEQARKHMNLNEGTITLVRFNLSISGSIIYRSQFDNIWMLAQF